jgi:hypothetical protein
MLEKKDSMDESESSKGFEVKTVKWVHKDSKGAERKLDEEF